MRAPGIALVLALASCSSRPPALPRDPASLAYRSRAKVDDGAARTIAAAALRDARRRPPWVEPIDVHTADGSIGDGRAKFVFGETRLFLREYESETGTFRQVEAGDDALVAYADALFAIGRLRQWSSAHGIEWDVQLGDQRGRVGAEGPDATLQRLLQSLARRAGAASPDQAEAARPALDAKYRDRREPVAAR